MTPPADAVHPDPAHADRLLHRFGRPVRWVHGLTAVLLLVCLGTAAVLYIGELAVLVGHRQVVERVHVWCGFALPVPLLAGLAFPGYRADLRRMDRFSAHDRRWLRSRARRDGTLPVGKFNAGQKLNGALSAGGIAVLLLSGTLMYYTGLVSLTLRTGATFVHDWTALGLALLVAGHLWFALHDRIALRGMRTGYVPRSWAQREHAAWAAELDD